MEILSADWLRSIFGGVLIGCASVLLLAFNGRIAGISGIAGGLLLGESAAERLWRGVFLAGLVAGGLVYQLLNGAFPLVLQSSAPMTILAGFLVGVGTRLGSGCTSGHGICGISRGAARSVVATVVFMVAGMLTVWFLRNPMVA